MADLQNINNRTRQARWISDPANREKKNREKREKRAREKLVMAPVVPDVIPIVVPIMVPAIKHLYDLDATHNFIQQNTINPNTRNKQSGALKSLFRVSGIDNIDSTMDTFNTIKTGIVNGIQLNGEPYSIGSKALQAQVVLVLIDKMKIPMTETVLKKYMDLYKEFKCVESKQIRDKINDTKQAVIPYKTYMDKIEKQFGKDSKQYLISALYNDVIARDNFGSLIIIPDVKYAVNKSQNYLIVSSNVDTPITLLLNHYKTVGRMGAMSFVLSSQLSNLLRYYILKNKLSGRLFPEPKNGLLSATVSSMNKKIGITTEGGINYIRHSKISEFETTNPTPEERRIFSERCQHSTNTQLDYNRVLIV